MNRSNSGHRRAPADVVMAGAFPPPVRGMQLVTVAVRERLIAAGVEPQCIDISSGSQILNWRSRARRFPKVIAGLVRLCAMRLRRPARFYISLSAGYGQLYDILFLLVARIRGMEIFTHHHSFAYLHSARLRTRALVRAAGPEARHAVQSRAMGDALKRLYGARDVFAFSNAVFLEAPDPAGRERSSLRTVGLLSNLSVDKGVWDFVRILETAVEEGLDIRGRLAGPFDDRATERRVLERLSRLPNATYDGPLYGPAKSAFFEAIDLFLFPTRYDNETEGVVNLEALRAGAPVIACGRGCIPEIVDADCGLVVPPADAFVPAALAQIRDWREHPDDFRVRSRAARPQFRRILAASTPHWRDYLDALAVPLDGQTVPVAVPAASFRDCQANGDAGGGSI